MPSSFTKQIGLASGIIGFTALSGAALAQTQTLFNSFESSTDMSTVRLSNAQAVQDVTNVTNGTKSLKATFQPGEFSTITLQPGTPWNATGTGGFAFDITNPLSTAQLVIGLRVDDTSNVSRTVNVVVEPGGKATFLLTADEDPTQYGIRYM
ncbi:hypothetical protein EON82_21290, partial [bacterium]